MVRPLKDGCGGDGIVRLLASEARQAGVFSLHGLALAAQGRGAIQESASLPAPGKVLQGWALDHTDLMDNG